MAPSWISASTSGPIGLRISDSSPVRVVVDGRREAIPVSMRMVVPEFFASMIPGDGLSSSQCIFIPPEELLISVPSACNASSVATVSSARSGLFSVKWECVRAPRTMARCVKDLDGGAVTVPFATEDLTTIAVAPPPSQECR